MRTQSFVLFLFALLGLTAVGNLPKAGDVELEKPKKPREVRSVSGVELASIVQVPLSFRFSALVGGNFHFTRINPKRRNFFLKVGDTFGGMKGAKFRLVEYSRKIKAVVIQHSHEKKVEILHKKTVEIPWHSATLRLPGGAERSLDVGDEVKLSGCKKLTVVEITLEGVTGDLKSGKGKGAMS